MSINAIITLTSDAPTLDGVRSLLGDATQLGAPDDLELLDGGHIALTGQPALMNVHAETLGGLRAWADEYQDMPGDTPVENGCDLAIDLPVTSISTISCGEHIGQTPDNILVTVNPACAAC